ncbi:MAG: hypothetical protein IPL61_40435 [Myxococcales bacterium]|nr:hypothetical protein [Myxococcales bacterium]
MMQRNHLLGIAALVALATSTAAAGPTEIYPLAKVRRGQTGYGMTTFTGATPERFEFEVVNIQKNFVPGLDIILVQSKDPKLAVSGFWRGMSGSPLYIDDKIACAFSYGFAFNKVVLGGCTPIEYMIKEGFETKRRSGPGVIAPTTTAPGTMAQWQKLAPGGAIDALFARSDSPTPWLLTSALPTPPARPTDAGAMTAAVPLAMGGFSAPAFAQVEQLFADYPLQPMRTGGGGGAAGVDGPTAFVGGGSIAVQLIRGDMSAAATGTVSYVDGNRVLAFGHPMFQAGEIYAPVASSVVQTVIASAQFPYVIATPAKELGSLVQDRSSMIMADTNVKSPMIPIDISVKTTDPTTRTVTTRAFHVEVIDDKFLTAAMAGSAVMNAVTLAAPDRDHVTALIKSSVKIKGAQELTFVDYLYANDGAGSVAGGARALRALGALSFNPFGPAKAERLRVDIDLTFAADYGDIEEVSLRTPELRVGRNALHVTLATAAGTEVVECVPFDVPATLAGAIVTVEVSAGDAARLDAAPPVDLASLLAAFGRLLPGDQWAVSVYLPDEGAAKGGVLVRDLPASALDKLHPRSTSQRIMPFKPMARTVVHARRVVGGAGSIVARVADETSAQPSRDVCKETP